MKTFKLNIGILAVVLGLALTFVTSAFKAEPRTDQVYYFNGSSTSQIKTVGEWSQNTIPTDCQEIADMPCSLTIPENVVLSDYLDEHSATEITEASEGRRPE